MTTETKPSDAAMRAAKAIMPENLHWLNKSEWPAKWNEIATIIDAEISRERDTPCPCTIADTPCQPRCTCVMGGSSSGCLCCSRYGSAEQRKASANRIVQLLSALATERSALIAVARAAKHLQITYRNYFAGAIFRHEWEDECDKFQQALSQLPESLRKELE